jgi:hypothetical protein
VHAEASLEGAMPEAARASDGELGAGDAGSSGAAMVGIQRDMLGMIGGPHLHRER